MSTNAHSQPDGHPWYVGVLKLGLGIFFLAGLNSLVPYLWQEAWWQWTIAPRLQAVEPLVKDNRAREAIPLVASILRDHPGDPGALAEMFSLYLLADEPLLAYFYREAYLRTEDWSSSRRTDVYNLGNSLREDIGRQLDSSFDEIWGIVESVPGAKSFAKFSDVQAMLNEPASAGADDPGYFYPKNPIPCGGRKLCGFKFSGSDIFEAVRLQAPATHEAAAGAGCCSLQLADPDLSLVPDSVQRSLDRIESDRPGLDLKSVLGVKIAASVTMRILAKQYFLFAFSQRADGKPPARNFVQTTFQVASYAAFVVLCLTVFFLLESWGDRIVRARKKA